MPAPKLTDLLKPYRPFLVAIVGLTIAGNGLTLMVPRLIARAIDGFAAGQAVNRALVAEFVAVAAGIFVLTYFQNLTQVFAAERVARDLRTRLVAKIASQSLAFVQQVTTAKLLTNLTSDVDAVKVFVSQAVGSIVSSIVLITGASALLLWIDWKLGLAVLAVLPVIGVTFYLVMGRVRALFLKAQAALDWLNKVINESILGAALIRLLDAHPHERAKFVKANTEARDVSLRIHGCSRGSSRHHLLPTWPRCRHLVLGGRFVIAGG